MQCFVSRFDLGTIEQQPLFAYQNKRLKCLLSKSVSEREEISVEILCLCDEVVEARNFTRLPVLQPLIQLHLPSVRYGGRDVLDPEVSEWLPKCQPGALKGCYFPIHVYKMVHLHLSLGHELMICFTHSLIHHWRTRRSLGGPLPF